jgi:hypothetical protein
MLSSITRFPGGVNNLSPDSGLADYRDNSPLVYNTMYDDFNKLIAADWTTAGTAPGAAALAASADGGVVALPTTVTNPSETSTSWNTLSYTPDITKDLFVSARVQIDDATLGGFLFGLSVGSAASPLGTPPVSGIYFRKPTGAATLQAVLRIASVDVAVATFPDPVVAATWYHLTIAYTAADGALRAFSGLSAVRLATNPASLGAVPMGLVFSVRNSSAAIRTLLIDNYLVAKAR